MRLLIVVAAGLIPASVSAQAPQPAKLILTHGEGLAITDFPSLAKCEAARAVIVRKAEQENAANPPKQLPNGGVIMTLPWRFRSMCVPA